MPRRSASTRSGSAVERALLRRAPPRKRRHAGIFEAISQLDMSLDAAARRELTDWIADQYRQSYESVPLGFVAVCYLGPPFVDHRLDLAGSIVEHYEPHQPMPGPFDSARPLARSCAFVEVFSGGELVAVRADGSTG